MNSAFESNGKPSRTSLPEPGRLRSINTRIRNDNKRERIDISTGNNLVLLQNLGGKFDDEKPSVVSYNFEFVVEQAGQCYRSARLQLFRLTSVASCERC